MQSFSALRSRRRTVPAERIHDGRMRLAGGTIAYTLAGAGPALLLIHGLGGNRHTWRPLLPGLSRTHTVIAPDLPGHGESDAPAGDYSLGAHASALRDLLLALGHRRMSVAGHSLGGGVALQTAYQFPERIDRLMLISSGGLGPEVSYLLRAATLPGAEAVVAVLSKIPPALTKRFLGALMTGADTELVAAVLHGLRGGQQRKAFIRTARSVIDWRGQTVSAARQTGLLRDVPVLVAWGADDTTIPPRHHLALAERVPHAVMVEIADAGHYPHETASAQLLPAMETFLRSTQPFRYSKTRWVEQLTESPENDGSPAPPTAISNGRTRQHIGASERWMDDANYPGSSADPGRPVSG
jgi:pimeloyl-ACP methyl ester carboxylesterase